MSMRRTPGSLHRSWKGLMALVLVLMALVSGISVAAGGKGKAVPPPTKRTQVIRPETFKAMEAAQKAYEAKDYAGAITALDGLKSRQDKLNDYERATLYNLYAAVYYVQGNNAKAIESYISTLKQPNLPEGLRDAAMYSLAQLYFLAEDYPRAIQVLNKWLSVVAEPSPEGTALLAQAYYQTQNYAEAEKALITSIKISKSRNQVPKEPALALLRAIYYERKQYDKAARVLEILVSSYPSKAPYWQQLAGMYGLLDRQADQTSVAHVAQRANLMNSEGDLLNVARLYLIAEAPYPAVIVIAQGLKNKTIKRNAENLQLLAQALALAREFKLQVPILKELSVMTGEAKHYVFLGQAYDELGDWESAASAYRAALRSRDVQRPDDVEMQLGTALFNANRLQEAREAFTAASRSENLQAGAANWIKFVDSEIARREAAKYMN